MIVRASESQHWYDREGKPAYSVTAKNGLQRPTTLRDARKLNLVPSVTTILSCASKPALEAWKLNQMMYACLTLPRVEGETEESFITRIVKDSKEQARQAAERGTTIHGALESFYEGIYLADFMDYQTGVDKAMQADFGTPEWSTEKSFCHELGFGGKVDLHSTSGQGVVVDFKTKEFKDPSTVEAYDEHLMQLSAYRVGLKIPLARCANVFVSVTEPGLVKVIEWSEEDLQRGWVMFQSLLNYWQAKNKHR
jgi:hypothetical protein